MRFSSANPPGGLLAVAGLASCSPGFIAAEAGTETSDGSSESGGSESESETDETGGGVCGNGVVELDEDCEPLPAGACDECTADCRFQPFAVDEWSVGLDPIAAVEVDAIEIGPQGINYVLGTADAEPIVIVVDAAGSIVDTFGTADHGFDAIVDHSSGSLDDLVILGDAGTTRSVRRVLPDGSFEAMIEVDPLTRDVALTEQHIAVLAPASEVRSFDFMGNLAWTSPEAWDGLDSAEGRLVMDNGNSMLVFVASDGGDPLAWGGLKLWPEGPDRFDPARVATSGATMVGGMSDEGVGEIYVSAISLWTGEEEWESLAEGPSGGLHFQNSVMPIDATPSGLPIAKWSLCTSVNDMNGHCLDYTYGIGGSGVGGGLELDGCGQTSTLRVGPDGGVLMVATDPLGGLRLVRRQTLE